MEHDDMSDHYYKTTIVAMPSHSEESKTVLLATNEEMVDDTIRLDRERTVEILSEYRDRGAIENAYKQIKKFLPWTASTEYIVRHFHLTFTIIIHVLRYLVDQLVQLRLNKPVRTKPRVKAGVFAQEARHHIAVIL